jgi:hypothetical protein
MKMRTGPRASKTRRIRRWALVGAAILAVTVLSVDRGSKAASSVPAPEEISHRISTAMAAARVASAAVQLRLYVHKPVTPPPDCIFAAALRVEQGRPLVVLGERSPGATCAIVERRALQPLFKGLEPLEVFLGRFELSVLDHKLVDGDRYYRIQGIARDPKGDPHGFIAWIDYDRGVIPEGTINYAWGDMDTRQTYDRINDALVLTRQVLYSPHYNVSLELLYSHFAFAPQ